ncbi:MAG: flagellar assembly protein FliX [Caulobacter sp.]|nr:flagellar assembly protein FliX [Caulobacter sp.]
MKVSGTGSVGATGASRAKPAGGGSGFSLPSVGAAAPAAGVAQAGGVGAMAGVGSLDALLALQANLDPMERKRRAVKRAGGLLDILDALKLATLDGDVSTGTLARLKAAVREHREATDDPNLEAILNEIETRAAVEAAKLEAARG